MQAIRIIHDEHRSLTAVMPGMPYLIRPAGYGLSDDPKCRCQHAVALVPD